MYFIIIFHVTLCPAKYELTLKRFILYIRIYVEYQNLNRKMIQKSIAFVPDYILRTFVETPLLYIII